MTRRGGLGRGLDALIPTDPDEIAQPRTAPPAGPPAEPPGSSTAPPSASDDELAARLEALTHEVHELRALVAELVAAIATLRSTTVAEEPVAAEPDSIAGLVAGVGADVLTLVRVSVELGAGVTRAAIAPVLRIATSARDHLPARFR